MKNLLLIITMAAFTSCAAVKVNSTFDPRVNFDDYKTFSLIEVGDIRYQGPDYGYSAERMGILQEVLIAKLESKGLTHVKISPNLLVGFHAFIEEQETLLSNNEEMLDPYTTQISYWDGYEDYYNQGVYRFLKGSLVIDIIDSKKGNVIWQSTARRYMNQIPNVGRDDINKGITKALKKYPTRK